MKRYLLSTALALGAAAAPAFAKEKPEKPAAPAPAATPAATPAAAPEAAAKVTGVAAADQRLARLYHGATLTKKAEREVNGVKVYDVGVKSGAGESVASVTEYGDFLASGVPIAQSNVPPRVAEALAGLFASPPKDVDVFVETYYFVYVNAGARRDAATGRFVKGGGLSVLKFDGAGRLLDISDHREVQQETADNKTAAAPAPIAQKLTADAQAAVPGASVTKVTGWEEAEGFYVASFTHAGHQGFFIGDENGDTVAERVGIDKGELPKPVAETLAALFKGDKINTVQRGLQRYYQFDQAAGHELLTLKIRPSGDVLSITSNAPTAERATPAEAASSKKHAVK